MTHPTKKFWRSPVRFVSISTDKLSAKMILPGWDSKYIIVISTSILPIELKDKICSGYRCYVQATIGAETIKDLKLGKWEIP